MRALLLTALLLAAAALAAPAPAHGQAAPALASIPPAPTRWVTDGAGVLSPAVRARLDARLAAYERATGHQVVLWIGDSIGDFPLDDWAVRTFDAWDLGRKGEDDGVALFVLIADRKIAIEVGYGLEGQLPDAVASRIISVVMAPRLRAGDHDGAMQAGVEAILAAIEGKPWPGAGEGTWERERGEPRPMPLGQKILFGLLALGFLVLMITNPRLAMLLLWSIVARGGGGGGGGGRGNGGFSGGGGRSGGGGARGGW